MYPKRRFFQLAMVLTMAYATTIFVACASAPKSDAPTVNSETKQALFMKANKSWQTALKSQADVLAPKNFALGVNHYKQAEADFRNGESLDGIRIDLQKSEDYFKIAQNAVKLAAVTFPIAMKARQDALSSESGKFSPELWTQAESKFHDAAGILEDGDVNKAKNSAKEAEKLYRQAELTAIKARYLTEAKNLIKQADQKDVKTYAPKTLDSAKKLIAQADKELNENRYDIDVARSLARQARYQVNHAMFLAETIKRLKDKDSTWEDLMLAAEAPLLKIAEQIGTVASFETGFIQPTNQIISYIATFQDSVARLDQDLVWSEQQRFLQHARITELVGMVGDQVQLKSDLASQIAIQNKTQKLFTDVEQTFSRNEARVLREGDDIIIRLVGLEFPSNEATIEQKSFALLTKVRDAVNTFEGSSLTVSGYTDSYGNDEDNLVLSHKRAEAVRQYILANTKLSARQVEAIGYGESQPIANNETELGRGFNRRVEVVIHPW